MYPQNITIQHNKTNSPKKHQVALGPVNGPTRLGLQRRLGDEAATRRRRASRVESGAWRERVGMFVGDNQVSSTDPPTGQI